MRIKVVTIFKLDGTILIVPDALEVHTFGTQVTILRNRECSYILSTSFTRLKIC